MKKIIFYTMLLTTIICLPASATVINIPDDYPTIQQGIDVSSDRDTVLVQPGTYVENINFYGHNIVLASLLLTTGDINYITETVIDGDLSGPVVNFFEQTGESSRITGFTIQNGLTLMGGGILCRYSDPIIEHNLIINNIAQGNELAGDGGGIYCSNSNPIIRNNVIVNNAAIWNPGSLGGGIYCGDSSPTIVNNTLSRNSSEYGSGIYCGSNSDPTIINTICWEDTSLSGWEIEFDSSSAPLISNCNIGDTLWPGWGNISEDPLFRDPENNDFRLLSIGCSDLDDSPCVDTGSRVLVDKVLDCDRGLRTIISDMGAYGGGDSATIEPDWIVCDVGSVHNYITNSTATRASGSNEWTIIIGDDANEYPSMIWTEPEEYADSNHYLYYAELRIGYYRTLAHLDNAASPGMDVRQPPESISDFDSHFEISNRPYDPYDVRVHENTFAWDDPIADDFIIYDFWIVNFGIQRILSLYVAFFADCDISAAGGGSGLQGFWRDDLAGYYRDYETGEFISYMYDGDNPNIPGDDEGGRYSPMESLGYLGSRLLYCPPIWGDTVPSVQQGHSWWGSDDDPGYDSIWFDYMSDDVWMDPPDIPEDLRYLQKTGPFDLPAGDSINVVFAFGIGEGVDGLRANLEIAQQLFDNGYVPTSIDSDQRTIPISIGLTNYPNPFNATTIIRYALLVEAEVTIEIYDILGRKIEILIQEEMPAGYHQVVWDATDRSSGIYFYKIQAGNYTETKKMVLIK